MPRILSQTGNVIAADFRPRLDGMTITLKFKSEMLYRDDAIMVTRTTALLEDRPIMVMNFLGDLKTGTIVHT